MQDRDRDHKTAASKCEAGRAALGHLPGAADLLRPGRADRAVEKLATFAGVAQATAALPGTPRIPHVYYERRGGSYTARKEFYTAAPLVETKARYGLPWFEAKWSGNAAAARPAKAANAPVKATGPAKGTRTAQILALVARPGGATLTQITDATGWQPHSVRAGSWQTRVCAAPL